MTAQVQGSMVHGSPVHRLNTYEAPVPAKAGIKRFEDIEEWQLARELTRKVYRLTKKPGFEKDYGLKRQIQEAAGSAMHNIAEGFDPETNPGFIRFLSRQGGTKRSCTEVQSELYVTLEED